MSEEYARETAALDTVVPLTPIAGALTDILSKAAGARTFDKATDSLEALRDLAATLLTAAGDLSATMKASVNTEVDSALNTAVPASPTADSLNDIMSKATGGNAFDKATDSLEMLSDKVGAYTGDGGTGADDSIKAEIDLVKAKTDTIAASPVSTASGTAAGVIVEDGTSGTPNVTATPALETANTFSAWAQIDASVSANSWICSVGIGLPPVADRKWVVELGTGAAGSEATKMRWSGYHNEVTQVGYPNILNITLSIPIKVASGTKLSVRAATDVGNAADVFQISVQYYQSLET